MAKEETSQVEETAAAEAPQESGAELTVQDIVLSSRLLTLQVKEAHLSLTK